MNQTQITEHEIEKKLGYHFDDTWLLKTALTHRSHNASHNERLEFLGDGILNYSIAVLLYQRFPDLPEGMLSRFRANLVRQDTLVSLAQSIDLGRYLYLGEGELKSGGRSRPSILADALEALIGALYLDAGHDKAYAWISNLYEEKLTTLVPGQSIKDAKSRLQEYLQAKHFALPKYSLLGPHPQGFEMICEIKELGITTMGSGSSRRSAEQAAADAALAYFPDLEL